MHVQSFLARGILEAFGLMIRLADSVERFDFVGTVFSIVLILFLKGYFFEKVFSHHILVHVNMYSSERNFYISGLPVGWIDFRV